MNTSDQPNPIEAAVECVIALLSEADATFLKNAEASDILMMHFGLGLWIRNNLGLWGDSPLRAFLLERGFTDEDEMSAGVIRAVKARLNGQSCEEALNETN